MSSLTASSIDQNLDGVADHVGGGAYRRAGP
jgi:hypothetical protein